MVHDGRFPAIDVARRDPVLERAADVSQAASPAISSADQTRSLTPASIAGVGFAHEWLRLTLVLGSFVAANLI